MKITKSLEDCGVLINVVNKKILKIKKTKW